MQTVTLKVFAPKNLPLRRGLSQLRVSQPMSPLGVVFCSNVRRFSAVSTDKVKASLQSRHFSSCRTNLQDHKSLSNGTSAAADVGIYNGPLTATFFRLKLFSLSSLGLAVTLTPFLFIIESNLPTVARFALAGTALLTSGVSTALVSWCGSPYVTTLRRVKASENDGMEVLEMTTLTLALRERITRVYDTDFLVDTKRPFAKWELAETITLPDSTQGRETGPSLGEEETVAETTDANGKVLGRWIVKWGVGGTGTCRAMGNVHRHFNVHEELFHL